MATKQDIAYLSDLGEGAAIPAGATPGNLVAFGEGRVLSDTGKKPSDFVGESAVSQMIDGKVDPVVTSLKAALSDLYSIAAYKSSEWTANAGYVAGDFCMHNGVGYRANRVPTADSFVSEEWDVVLSADGKLALDNLLSGFSPEGYATLLNLAPAFGNYDYEVGNLVIKGGIVQICTTAGRGAAAIFTSNNANVDAAITSRIAPFKSHVENTSIHVSAEDRSNWNAKQDAIEDLADIRNKANAGADAAKRDFVVVESESSVKACTTNVSEVNDVEVEHNLSGDVVQANGFKLDLRSYCLGLLHEAFDDDVNRMPEKIKFSGITIYSSGSTSSARMAIYRNGVLVDQSGVITLRGSSSVSSNEFEFSGNVWLDAAGEYEFRILVADSDSYISGLNLRIGDSDISISGFATGNSGTYTSRDGCFSGDAQFDIRFYDTVVDLAKKEDVPTKVSQLQNDENFVKQQDLPPGLALDTTLTKPGEAADAKAVGDALASAGAFYTQGIKYSSPDVANSTIETLTFGNMNEAADNDNSDLTGNVSIPPYHDINDNRYTVVGIQGSSDAAWSDNENIVTLTTPPTLKTIGNRAFYECTHLASASLAAVEELGSDAFYGCYSLQSVSLPTAVQIGNSAFAGCTALNLIDFGYIPHQSIPTLGTNAFPNPAPAGCRIVVPDSQYADWTAETMPDPEDAESTIPNPWHALIAQGYTFLRYSEWDVVRHYELSNYATAAQGAKADSAIQGIKVNNTTINPNTDKIVNITVPTAGSTTPSMATGEGSAGSGTAYSRSNHIHPAETQIAYALSEEFFPISYTHFASGYNLTATSNRELLFLDVGYLIILCHVNSLYSEGGGRGYNEIANFNKSTLTFNSNFSPSDIRNLTFNGAEPNASNNFPFLYASAITVRKGEAATVGTHDARNLRDLSRAYTLWEESESPADKAGGYYIIFFKPTAFGASANCIIREITIRTSDTANQLPINNGQPIYAKIIDPDNTAKAMAVSRPTCVIYPNTDYTFIFDDDATLTYTKQYKLAFYTGKADGSDPINYPVRLTQAFTDDQDIYYDHFPKRRPITKFKFSDSDLSSLKAKISQQIAPDFTAKAYVKDELCSYNNTLYRCILGYTSSVSSAKPDNDSTHWVEDTDTLSQLFVQLAGSKGPLKFAGTEFKVLGNGAVDGKAYVFLSTATTYNNAGDREVARKGDLPTNKTASSGGTETSLVTTGDKYNWNNKISKFTGTIPTGYIVQVKSDGTIESSLLLASSVATKTLSGNTYDFSTNVGLYTAVRDLVAALGGTVTNFPAIS